MENKKTSLTPVLEKVSALALLIIAIINVLEFVASAFRSASAAVIILNISLSLTGFIFVTIPLIVIAVIVLRGKLRAPESKKPVSIAVDTFGTGKIPDGKIVEIIHQIFDLRPAAIIEALDLKRPIYQQTAAYGHFGRTDIDLPWEHLDQVEKIKALL